VEDIIAFAESIGEPVGLVGYSLGGSLGLGAAAHTNAIRAIAVYEPGVYEALTPETGAVFAESSRRLVEASAAGRPVQAARVLLEPVAHEDEMAALTAAGAFEAWARNIPVVAQEIQRADQWDGPGPTAPSTLARIDVPALYLVGSRARTWHRDAARYLAEHVDGLRVVEIGGAGHFGPLLSPEPIADALIRFFETIPELSTEPGRTPDNGEDQVAMPIQTDQPTLTRVTSRDGTEIGYWTTGQGPPLVLVHGALGDHTRWSALRPYLEPHFTIHAMDRRGRGASGDHPEYDFAREVEDVAAVVNAVAVASGSPVDVLGSSVGGSFALAAASSTSNIRRLVLFEPPGHEVLDLLPTSLKDRLDELLAAGDREAVLETAYRAVAGVSDAEIEHLRRQPEWPSRVAAAHTVPRELRIPPERMFDPEQAASVAVPTLVLVGGDTPEAYKVSAEAVARSLPAARVVILDGQGHGAEMFAPAVVAEPVLEFLEGNHE
jgi:pimeloyl-ACP methyl ester carboxylesterase